jgi:hypothetical protein
MAMGAQSRLVDITVGYYYLFSCLLETTAHRFDSILFILLHPTDYKRQNKTVFFHYRNTKSKVSTKEVTISINQS